MSPAQSCPHLPPSGPWFLPSKAEITPGVLIVFHPETTPCGPALPCLGKVWSGEKRVSPPGVTQSPRYLCTLRGSHLGVPHLWEGLASSPVHQAGHRGRTLRLGPTLAKGRLGGCRPTQPVGLHRHRGCPQPGAVENQNLVSDTWIREVLENHLNM